MHSHDQWQTWRDVVKQESLEICLALILEGFIRVQDTGLC